MATITIGIPPEIQLGPVSLAWHGLTIALGLLLALYLARRFARERELDVDRITNAVLVMALSGIIGSRLLYLIINEPASLIDPTRWFGTNGFAIYGAVIIAPIAGALFLGKAAIKQGYLDVLAAAFPFALALGRVGDLINGEHYGPPTDLPWGVRHTSPDALVPSTEVAYHDGGLYEIVLGLLIGLIIWPLRHRFRKPTTLLWSVLALYGLGRFFMFFSRSDSEPLALGLVEAQWISLVLVAGSLAGLILAWRRPRPLDLSRRS